VLEARRFCKIVFDALAARFQNRGDPWQRNSRHQQIKRDEGKHEPEQLGCKGVRIEGRKSLTALAPRNVLDRRNGLRTLLSHRQTPNVTPRAQDRPRLGSIAGSYRAINNEKMPSASVTAKPKIRLPNWPWAADGLRSAAAR